MSQPAYRTKLSRKTVEGLHDLIRDTIECADKPDDYDKLMLSVLDLVQQRFAAKLTSRGQKEFRMSFPPAQAIAIRLLFIIHVKDHTSFIGNELHRLSNDIHQWSI